MTHDDESDQEPIVFNRTTAKPAGFGLIKYREQTKQEAAEQAAAVERAAVTGKLRKKKAKTPTQQKEAVKVAKAKVKAKVKAIKAKAGDKVHERIEARMLELATGDYMPDIEPVEKVRYDMTLMDRTWRVAGKDEWFLEGGNVHCPNARSLNNYLSAGNFTQAEDKSMFHIWVDKHHTLEGVINHPFLPVGRVSIKNLNYWNKSKNTPVEPIPVELYREDLIAHEIQFFRDLCLGDDVQFDRFLGLLREIYRRTLAREGFGKNLPALILTGGVNAGKTLAISHLVGSLVGSVGTMAKWLYDRENFTANMFSSPLLVADDADFLSNGSDGFAQGRLKQLVAEVTQDWRGMHRESVTMPWGGLAVALLNENKLRKLISADGANLDKFVIIKAGAGYAGYADHWNRVTDNGSAQGIRNHLDRIAPHLARYLLNGATSSTSRFVVEHYCHPDLRLIVGVPEDAEQALDLIDVYFNGQPPGVTEEPRISASAFLEFVNEIAPASVRGLHAKSINKLLTWLDENGFRDRCRKYKYGKDSYYFHLTRAEQPISEPSSPVAGADKPAQGVACKAAQETTPDARIAELEELRARQTEALAALAEEIAGLRDPKRFADAADNALMEKYRALDERYRDAKRQLKAQSPN